MSDENNVLRSSPVQPEVRINIDDFLDNLLFVDPREPAEIKAIEEEYDCVIVFEIEKHHVLQFTYYYEIDFKKSEMFYVEIESGIRNGTQLINAEWGIDTKEKTKTVEVLKDIVLDNKCYKDNKLLRKEAEAILLANKSKLFEYHRQNNYDNYFTGGHSKMKLPELLSRLHLKYIYEEKVVDRNFV